MGALERRDTWDQCNTGYGDGISNVSANSGANKFLFAKQSVISNQVALREYHGQAVNVGPLVDQ